MFFTRHGITSGPGLWRKRLTSTRIPRAFLCSTCPANNVSAALKSSSVIEEVASFQAMPMTRPSSSQEIFRNLSSCSCMACIIFSSNFRLSSKIKCIAFAWTLGFRIILTSGQWSGRLHVDLRPVGKSREPARHQGLGRSGALFVLGTEVGILLEVLIHLAHFLRARKEGVVGLGWLDSDRLQFVPLRV